MANYIRRLDEIITLAIRRGIKIGRLMEKNDVAFTDFTTDKEYHDITQLFRDMVKEAKPDEFTSHLDSRLREAEHVVGRFVNDREEELYGRGSNAGANEFESNLLKLIGEKE